MLKKNVMLLLSFLLFLSFVTLVQAETPEKAQPESSYLQEELDVEFGGANSHASALRLPNVFDVTLRFLFSLLIIVALIWAAAVIYKKIYGPKYFFGHESSMIKILERRYLDSHNALYLVEIAGRILLMSAGDTTRLVCELESEDEKKMVFSMLEQRSEEYRTPEFKKMLQGFSDTFTDNDENPQKANPVPAQKSSGISGIQDTISKLKRMLNEKK